MVCELTVIVKDEARTLKTKHLIYDEIKLNAHDPIISKNIQETVKAFGSEPTDIKIRITQEVE
jgi:hypothetical protein